MNGIEIVWRPWLPFLPLSGLLMVLAGLSLFTCVRTWPRIGRRSLILLALRICTVIAIGFILAGPSGYRPVEKPDERSRLTILVDTSESMRTADCGGQSRIAQALGQVLRPELLEQLKRHAEVQVRGFDTITRSLDWNDVRTRPDDFAQGRETRLMEVVSTSLAELENPSDALLVISDGRETSDDSSQRIQGNALREKGPVFTVPLGQASSRPDAAVVATALNENLLPDEEGTILVRIDHTGLKGASGLLRFRSMSRDGEQTFPVTLSGESPAEIRIPVRESQTGQYEYEVVLDPVGSETGLSNNRQPVFLEVSSRRLRVLILEGEPYWDTRFIAQSLRKDEQVEVVQITQIGEDRQETLVSSKGNPEDVLSESHIDWSRFDVVIVGRGLQSLLTTAQARSLVAHVQAGGHLVMARSRPYQTSTAAGRALSDVLSEIDPVQWGTGEASVGSLRLTDGGRRDSWMAVDKFRIEPDDAFRRLPPLDHLDLVAGMSPASTVLIEMDAGPQQTSSPVVVRRPVGRGSTLVMLGDGMWRWSLLTPERQDLRGFYDLFWSNLVRWMVYGGDFAPGQQAALQLSRRSVRQGDELIIDVVYRFAPEAAALPTLQVETPGGTLQAVSLEKVPGPSPRFRGTYFPSSAGVHQARVSTPGLTSAELSARFNVTDFDRERMDPSADPNSLRMLSEMSGGTMLEADGIAALPDLLARHRLAVQPAPVMEYLWDRTVAMWLLLGWISTEWLVRRRIGLW